MSPVLDQFRLYVTSREARSAEPYFDILTLFYFKSAVVEGTVIHFDYRYILAFYQRFHKPLDLTRACRDFSTNCNFKSNRRLIIPIKYDNLNWQSILIQMYSTFQSNIIIIFYIRLIDKQSTNLPKPDLEDSI